jgi:hypothetical protein
VTRPGNSPGTDGAARRPGTRPSSAPGSARADGNRRPYPTAPNISRVSPARPARRSSSSTTSPTPATVWACGPAPVPLDEDWPVHLVEHVVRAFSRPRDSVVILPWPTSSSSTAASVEAVNDLGRRTNSKSDVELEPTSTADLVITSAPPNQTAAELADQAARTAAQLLRVGGIFVALTHSDSCDGELTDHSGRLVTSAQYADLLYLQHIVAVHAPIHSGRFQLNLDDHDVEELRRARHRSAVRRLPAPHLRIHSDVLVFAQPHDHTARPLAPAQAVVETGVVR